MSESGETAKNAVVKRKQQLRKDIRSKLRALSTDDIKVQSEKVWTKLFDLEQYRKAKSIGLFLSMPTGEIQTDIALRDAVRQNKTIFVPKVGENFEKADMELLKIDTASSVEDDRLFFERWPRNKWNIPEPPESSIMETAKPGDIDLLVVPGLGFDDNGNRLGQGKGYYDRFISRMNGGNAKSPFLVAVGLSCCRVQSQTVPVNEYDQQMDMILLPDEVIVVK